jgi:hypothetical protein
VCEQDGDVSSGVVREWCGWACDRLCGLGSGPFSVDINVQEWKVAFFLSFIVNCILLWSPLR